MRNIFEGHNLAEVNSREVRMSEIEEKLYGVLVGESQDGGAERNINPKDFSCYSSEVIERDSKYVERMEGIFKSEEIRDPELGRQRRRGRLFEEIIFEGIEEGDWMGGGAEVQKSSRFDDIVNKVDGIITFVEEMSSSHMAFGVDVTQSAESVSDKFRKIKKSIQMETLSEVKYFKSEDYEGRLLKVPRVVVGVDGAGMRKASEIVYAFISRRNYLRAQKVKDPGAKQRFAEAQDAFAESIFQMVILLEMSIQLHAFGDYCRRTQRGKEAGIYDKAARKIDAIFNEKKMATGRNGEPLVDMKALYEYLGQDEVYAMIRSEAESFGQD
jgi:hypothetical protein